MERRLRSEGRWQSKNFTQPKLIKLYNSNMGGVDLGDQRIATCSKLMKGNNFIWYNKIFFHMLEVAVLNAHIMHQGDGHHSVSLGDFKELLVEQLIGGNSFRRDTLSPNVPQHVPDVHFNGEHFHYPVKAATHRNCKVHFQRVETVYECGICQVRMCPAPCFERYHTWTRKTQTKEIKINDFSTDPDACTAKLFLLKLNLVYADLNFELI